MNKVITDTAQITPEWLTGRLYENGTLTSGKVETIAIQKGESFTANLAYLSVSYSADTNKKLPEKFIMKMGKSVQWMLEAGEYEVSSYQTFAKISREIPGIVNCFSAEYSTEANNYYVLLEDISDTHAIALPRDEVIKGIILPPERLEEVLDCLAKFHAFWWEHPKLGEGVLARHYWFKDAESAKLLFEKRNRELDLFVDNVGANFSPDLIVLYREVLAKFPAMYERYIAERLKKLEKVTLVHGDCYLNQFFCPKETGKYPTYLLDMQSLSAYFPADDLSHIIPAFWTSEQRQPIEESLLKFYWERLQSYGVKNYTWADLQQDYKLSIIYLLFEAIWNQTDGSTEAYWRRKLNCLTEAFLGH